MADDLVSSAPMSDDDAGITHALEILDLHLGPVKIIYEGDGERWDRMMASRRARARREWLQRQPRYGAPNRW